MKLQSSICFAFLQKWANHNNAWRNCLVRVLKGHCSTMMELSYDILEHKTANRWCEIHPRDIRFISSLSIIHGSIFRSTGFGTVSDRWTSRAARSICSPFCSGMRSLSSLFKFSMHQYESVLFKRMGSLSLTWMRASWSSALSCSS